MASMTPAERFLELEKARKPIVDIYNEKLTAKEQEIIKHLKARITHFMNEYKEDYGTNYVQAMRDDKMHTLITDNTFDKLVNDLMELMYD
jgi:hypothetical protein